MLSHHPPLNGWSCARNKFLLPFEIIIHVELLDDALIVFSTASPNIQIFIFSKELSRRRKFLLWLYESWFPLGSNLETWTSLRGAPIIVLVTYNISMCTMRIWFVGKFFSVVRKFSFSFYVGEGRGIKELPWFLFHHHR